MRLVLLAFVIAQVTSCASRVSVWMPQQRFVSSETQGDLGDGHIAFGYANKTQLILADNLDQTTIDLEPKIYADSGFEFNASMGLLEMVDVYYNMDAGVGGKVQLLGPHRLEARPESFSLAVAASVGSESGNSEESKSFDLTRTIKIKTSSEASLMDMALIGGYRTSKESLFYVAAGQTAIKAAGSYEREISGQPIEKADIPSASGNIRNLLLGFDFGENGFHTMLEGGIAQTSFGRAKTKQRTVFGGTIGYRW